MLPAAQRRFGRTLWPPHHVCCRQVCRLHGALALVLVAGALMCSGVAFAEAADNTRLVVEPTSTETITSSRPVSGNRTGSTTSPPPATQPPTCFDIYGRPLEACDVGDRPCIIEQIELTRYALRCNELNITTLETLPMAEKIYEVELNEYALGSGVTITNVTGLTFEHFASLQSLQMRRNGRVRFEEGALSSLKLLHYLDVAETALTSSQLPTLPTELTELQASDSSIQKIAPNTFVGLSQLRYVYLNRNKITRIEAHAFRGACFMQKLFLRANMISSLDENAFKGLDSLIELDLSDNPISRLPDSLIGFDSIKTLWLQLTPNLKLLPSRFYNLRKLTTAHLYYAPHCCLFNKPKNLTDASLTLTGSPQGIYEQYNCSLLLATTPPPTVPPVTTRNLTIDENVTRGVPPTVPMVATSSEAPATLSPQEEHCLQFPNLPFCPPLGRRRKRREANKCEEEEKSVEQQVKLIAEVLGADGLCRYLEPARQRLGNFTSQTTWRDVTEALLEGRNASQPPINETKLTCTPIPDEAFTPCDDLMTWVWLRVVVWIVFIFGFFVNLFVFLVVVLSKRQWDTYRELTLHLVIGDLCIALFLGVLAVADLRTEGDYAAQALGWQDSAGCQLVGFVSMLGSQVVVTTLAIITIERFYKITFRKRLNPKRVRVLLAVAWLYSILTAAMPLFGFSDYSTVATCMPFEVATLRSEIYLGVVLSLNVVMCLLIAVLYIKVTASTYMQTHRILTTTGNIQFQKHQFSTLKRSAPLVLCNMACVMPIAIIGLISIFQQSAQIDNRASKIVLVIVFPINCLANPILYGLGRKSLFHDHMFDFLYKRLGLFSNRFQRRRSMVFYSPSASCAGSRRGSVDSTLNSGPTSLRRGLSLPVGILTTNNFSGLRRSLSEGQTSPRGIRTPDRDSAYSSGSSDGANPPKFCKCISSGGEDKTDYHRPALQHNPHELDMALVMKRIAAMQNSIQERDGRGARASIDTQMSTVTGRSTVMFSPCPAVSASSPRGLSIVSESDPDAQQYGFSYDPQVHQYESSV